jgi:predicted nuclease of predicted toxin-antitoxin system
MRFLVDECTGPAVAQWLRGQAHDACCVYEVARGASDAVLLAQAVAEDRILVTNDSDFGEMVFRERRPHCGIVLLRLQDERSSAKIAALQRLLAQYADQLGGAFAVVTERHIRFAAAARSYLGGR